MKLMDHPSKTPEIQPHFASNEPKSHPYVRLDINETLPVGAKVGRMSTQAIAIYDQQNRLLGGLSLRVNQARPGSHEPAKAVIDNIQLGREYQGLGYGKATYLELLKHLDRTVLQSGALNENSEKIWKSLVNDGLAEEIQADIEGSKYYRSIPSGTKKRWPRFSLK